MLKNVFGMQLWLQTIANKIRCARAIVGGNDLVDAHRFDAIAEGPIRGCIPIPQQIVGRSFPREVERLANPLITKAVPSSTSQR